MREIIKKLEERIDLDNQIMTDAVNQIMSGEVEDPMIEDFLIKLNAKGITENEISSAAQVMRSKSLSIDLGNGAHVDTCGTGGTGLNIFNCSTAASFVAAAGGAQITKHGNKGVSSKSGSADLLMIAGANINHDRNHLKEILNEVGFIFLFAPLHHQAMKFVMPARQRIGKKTIFNLLGPHTNPCNAKRQILGVYDKGLLKTFGNVSNLLKMHHVLVVHGNDGLDEISITDKTFVTELKDGNLNQFEIQPEDFGMSRSNITALKAETPQESLELINAAFEGKESPAQDMISLYAGASLYLSSASNSIKEGVSLAKELLNNGKAKQTFSSYIEMTNSL